MHIFCKILTAALCYSLTNECFPPDYALRIFSGCREFIFGCRELFLGVGNLFLGVGNFLFVSGIFYLCREFSICVGNFLFVSGIFYLCREFSICVGNFLFVRKRVVYGNVWCTETCGVRKRVCVFKVSANVVIYKRKIKTLVCQDMCPCRLCQRYIPNPGFSFKLCCLLCLLYIEIYTEY